MHHLKMEIPLSDKEQSLGLVPHTRRRSIQQSAKHIIRHDYTFNTIKNYHYLYLVDHRRHDTHADDVSCLMFPGCDGCAASAEHQRLR